MKHEYFPRGVCPMKLEFELDGDKVKNIVFTGGCNGNTQGISKLVEGMNIDDVITRLKGTDCRGRGTSCPDQLACALELAKREQ